jgi:hypothetical protein
MSVANVLSSEMGLTVLGTLLGGVWTAFRSSEWYRRVSERRYNKALQALEAGIELTYRTYVRAIKQSREDGKLTDEERQQARRQARQAAIEFGRSQGVDVAREVGAEYMDALIAKLVGKLKRGAE